mmetsp:Transcript_26027/g.65460  ORF Transcript_26027/g.65460 Transcript_26027/m.65460 type:complete len:682 (+) Transcript_26027:146-2191(+)
MLRLLRPMMPPLELLAGRPAAGATAAAAAQVAARGRLPNIASTTTNRHSQVCRVAAPPSCALPCPRGAFLRPPAGGPKWAGAAACWRAQASRQLGAQAGAPSAVALRERLVACLQYEAAKGYVNVISPETGAQFSDVLMELLHALSSSSDPQDRVFGGTARDAAATYAECSAEQRRDTLDAMLSQLGGGHQRTVPSTPVPREPIPVMIDLETSGFSPARDSIIEIAAYAPLTESTFDRLVSIEDAKLRTVITEVTGITDNMLQQEGVPLPEALSAFIDFVSAQCPHGSAPMLVAHNGKSFDFRFLAAQMRIADVAMPPHWLGLDSLHLVRSCVPNLPSYKLQDLREHFGLPPPELTHRGLPDAMVLSGVVAATLRTVATKERDVQSTLLQHSFRLGPAQLSAATSSTNAATSKTPGAGGAVNGRTELRPSGDPASPSQLPRDVPHRYGAPAGRSATRDAPQPAPTRSPPAQVAVPAADAPPPAAGPETLDMYTLSVAKCKDLTPTQRNKLLEARFFDIESLLVRAAPRDYISFEEAKFEDGATTAVTGYVKRTFVATPRPTFAVLNIYLSVKRAAEAEDGDSEYETVQVSKFMSGGYARAALWKIAAQYPEGSTCVAKGKLTLNEVGRMFATSRQCTWPTRTSRKSPISQGTGVSALNRTKTAVRPDCCLLSSTMIFARNH